MKQIKTIMFCTFFLLTINFNAAAKISVHGHRGARAVRPENTLSAFSYALDVGVDFIELDLAVTKDNKLVVSHDPFVDPVICLDDQKKRFKAPVAIRGLTLKQIKTYDCGSLINPRFKNQVKQPGQKIPTLSEVFDLVKNSKLNTAKTVQFNIETKIKPSIPHLSPSPKDFAKLLVHEIKRHGMSKRVIVQSFDYRTLKWVKKLEPKIKISQLTHESMVDLVAAAKAIDADYISPNQYWITKGMVKRLHKNGVLVAPWTANNKPSWDYLIKIGVDAIITDDPKGLITYLKSLKLR